MVTAPKRVLSILCALALLAVASLAVSGATAAAPTAAAKKGKAKGKGKKCKKGYVVKTVTKHGKKVKVCRKKPPKPGPVPPSPGPASLFEPPGRKLEGNDAVPFLQRYLANSTFTDCPAGWPNCAVEQRYSHASDGSFYYCRLTSSSGSDIRFSSEYGVQNAVVEADGSWTFNEQVANSGNSSFYEWHVATDGTVTGAYQFNGGAPEQLGPLQYVGGVAKDCSY